MDEQDAKNLAQYLLGMMALQACSGRHKYTNKWLIARGATARIVLKGWALVNSLTCDCSILRALVSSFFDSTLVSKDTLVYWLYEKPEEAQHG